MSGFPILLEEHPQLNEERIIINVPLKFRRGHLRDDPVKSIHSAVVNLNRIAVLTGYSDWSNLHVLDYGCGVKFSQALLQYCVKVGSYTGLDVYTKMIEFLQGAILKDNFHYYSVPFRNEMYNRNGQNLTEHSSLPGLIRSFDLITLQSVFTHFCPSDFLSLLHVLRRYSSDKCRLFFTCFINDQMEEDFFDSDPQKPLLIAQYKESFIRTMLRQSNWDVISVNPPGHQMVHQFVCSPS